MFNLSFLAKSKFSYSSHIYNFIYISRALLILCWCLCFSTDQILAWCMMHGQLFWMNNHFELYVFLDWTPGTVASLRRAAPHMTNINESDLFSSMRDTSGWTMWEITYNYTFVHRQIAVYVKIFYYHHGIGFCVDSYYFWFDLHSKWIRSTPFSFTSLSL